jgi:hypothetical protein
MVILYNSDTMGCIIQEQKSLLVSICVLYTYQAFSQHLLILY